MLRMINYQQKQILNWTQSISLSICLLFLYWLCKVSFQPGHLNIQYISEFHVVNPIVFVENGHASDESKGNKER